MANTAAPASRTVGYMYSAVMGGLRSLYLARTVFMDVYLDHDTNAQLPLPPSRRWIRIYVYGEPKTLPVLVSHLTSAGV